MISLILFILIIILINKRYNILIFQVFLFYNIINLLLSYTNYSINLNSFNIIYTRLINYKSPLNKLITIKFLIYYFYKICFNIYSKKKFYNPRKKEILIQI